MESKVYLANQKSGHHFIYLDNYNIQRRMNKQSGFNAEQINKDKYPESKNHLKIKSKITSNQNKTKTVRLSNQRVMQEKITHLSKFSTLFIDLCLVVSIQVNYTCHFASTQLRDFFILPIWFFSFIEPMLILHSWG
jgi:hypothetical protein